jgi:hypothetical protein
MDTMAALFEAMSSTPAAGEPSPAAPPTLADRHAQPRLSFAPPLAETPEPATALAARGDPRSAVDITTISMSPAAHSAEVRAALAMAAAAAETARPQAIIKDFEYAAVIYERDKAVAAQAAENMQLRREMEHMHAMHAINAQRAQYETDLLRSQLAAAPTILHPPARPAVDGPAPVATEVTKLIIRQLSLHNPPAAIAANALAKRPTLSVSAKLC